MNRRQRRTKIVESPRHADKDMIRAIIEQKRNK